jgi:hypothetical protein
MNVDRGHEALVMRCTGSVYVESSREVQRRPAELEYENYWDVRQVGGRARKKGGRIAFTSMALVGPRPLLPEYLPLYTPEQMRRHEVKPGITGWAQVNGRNAISWEEKFRLDVWYVDNRSFWLDCKILWMTVWQVLVRRNVSAAGHATMPPFRGAVGTAQGPSRGS